MRYRIVKKIAYGYKCFCIQNWVSRTTTETAGWIKGSVGWEEVGPELYKTKDDALLALINITIRGKETEKEEVVYEVDTDTMTRGDIGKELSKEHLGIF